jgi:hypothetical protein
VPIAWRTREPLARNVASSGVARDIDTIVRQVAKDAGDRRVRQETPQGPQAVRIAGIRRAPFDSAYAYIRENY